MTTFDQHKNFAISTVATAPVPALAGLTLIVAAAEGALFPAAPFNAVVFPANTAPTVANAEIVRVTSKGTGDNWTIVRTQEATAARSIQVGDRIMNAITVKALTDIEAALATAGGAVVFTAQPVLETGQANQIRAGRVLTLADFATLLGLPSVPVGLFNLGDLSNLGTGGALTNKGGVTFGGGIMGAAAEAAIFTGSTGQALYIADSGAADPFRIPYGSMGCWFRTAKRGTTQVFIGKLSAANNLYRFGIDGSTNTLTALINTGAGAGDVLGWSGVTDVCDDRWHQAVLVYDGSMAWIYLDGILEGAKAVTTPGPISSLAAPFNIGAQYADGATAAANPNYGRTDETFVTLDILSADQARLLYATKVAHTFGAVPISAKVAVRRQRKSSIIAPALFSVAPLHLYNFAAGLLTDQGSLAVALTNNNGATVCPGAEGNPSHAFNFAAASTQNLSATDAGLPQVRASRSIGCWFKTAAAVSYGLIGYGDYNAGRCIVVQTSSGAINVNDGAAFGISATGFGSVVYDGQWHFVVATYDDAPADGLRGKLYLDGRLVGSTTTQIASTLLLGANGFRIAVCPNGTTGPLPGQVDAGFVTDYAMTVSEIVKFFQVGVQSLGVSPKTAGDHVEAMDAASVYLVADPASGINSQDLLDLEVAA